jgi:hypothetical protein
LTDRTAQRGADPRYRALVLKTLQIGAGVWQKTIAEYERLMPLDGDPESRLQALGRAYAKHSPHRAPLPPAPLAGPCPVCGTGSVNPLLARQPGPVIYGRCGGCAHGTLLDRGDYPSDELYDGDGYYRQRDRYGVGYHDYAGETAYREAKGERVMARISEIAGDPVKRLLEVGSGYGFTRAAAERRGLVTGGVDINPHACLEAERRYGLKSYPGTLSQALADPDSGIAPAGWDAVLYQFVLEHLPDPRLELRTASVALSSRGWLALWVPSMEAMEIEVFGASYRSFRADHLQLFSRASLRHLLASSGFEPRWVETTCSIHLFQGFLSPPELDRLYASGLAPDFFVLARRIT